MKSINNKNYLLTLTIASLSLFSIGILVHDAFAMGPSPGSCTNEYDGPFTNATITAGNQTYYPMMNNVSFQLTNNQSYNITLTIKTPSQNNQNNTEPGTVWVSSNAIGYDNNYCLSTAYPNQNFTFSMSFGFPNNYNSQANLNQTVYWTVGVPSADFSYTVYWMSPATQPSSPGNLQATAVSPSQINLNWTIPSSDGGSAITGYEIERSIEDSSTWNTIVSDTNHTSTGYSNTALSSNTTYTYRVSAINSIGTSPPSNTALATTPSSDVVATIQVGNAPEGVGVNSATNKIYVANLHGQSVSVIDGSTNTVMHTTSVEWDGKTFLVGSVAVNPNTNLIYALTPGYLVTINGTTDSIMNFMWICMPSHCNLNGFDMDSSTNKIYIGNDNAVEVITGTQSISCTGDTSNQCTPITISLANTINGVGVDSNTHLIYVANGNVTSVIAGKNNTVLDTISVGKNPKYGVRDVGVNSNTNKIYVPNLLDNTVSVINGTDNNVIATIPIGNGMLSTLLDPHHTNGVHGISINPNTNLIYVGNFQDNTTSVINGSDNSNIGTIRVGNGPFAVGVNSATNKIYVANWYDNTTSVIYDNSSNVYTVPSVPMNLSASANVSQINLGWNAPSDNGGKPITGYVIERSTDNGSSWATLVANTDNTRLSYTDTNILPLLTYTYRVSAINNVGTSSPSNTASASTPAVTLP